MSSTAKRKLAAIVFADIAGYTDKTNRDEAGTLDFRSRVERLLKSSTLGHNGRIVKNLGDGAMLEFASAVEAVSAALDIQDQMEQLNRDLELAEPIHLRIGVHVGDVVEENEDLFGNAVNIAARVLAMAQPGGICITREVYVQIRPILKLQCAPVAGNTTDRLPEKVEVFAILGEEVEGLAVGPKRRPNPASVVALSLAALALIIVAFAMFRPDGGAASSQANVHRILLPDWVTPGEWFELDAGPQGSNLAVFFGNRKAQAELVGGRLRVKTPSDLPTAQTTISVFESGSAKPLLNQQTEVIRINSLAMNSTPANADPIGQSGGPNVEIDSAPKNEKPTPRNDPPAASPPTPAKANGAVAPGSGSVRPPIPGPGSGVRVDSAPPSPGAPVAMRIPPMEGMKEYESMMASIGDPEFKFEKIDVPTLKELPGHIGKAMRTLTLVQTGQPEKARDYIKQVRVHLKDVDPQSAAECEAILKTAEAFMDEKTGLPKPNQKWAQAFAFSMNRGTRSFPGLVMIDHLIDNKKYEEARRAIALVWERKDLSQAERSALERLQARINRSGSATTPTPKDKE